MSNNTIIGREYEIGKLNELYDSKSAKLVVSCYVLDIVR